MLFENKCGACSVCCSLYYWWSLLNAPETAATWFTVVYTRGVGWGVFRISSERFEIFDSGILLSNLTEDTTPRVREMAFRTSSILQSSLYSLVFTNGWVFFHFQWPSGMWIWYECSRLQNGQKICKFFSSINCPFIVQCEAPTPIYKIILKCRLPTHYFSCFPSFFFRKGKRKQTLWEAFPNCFIQYQTIYRLMLV